MTQQTIKSLEQSISLNCFIKSVSSELIEVDWFDGLEGLSYDLYPEGWSKTIIPLAVRLYELSQSDIEALWWLLQLMSRIDVCKDWKEDFRKSDVFRELSRLKQEQSKVILNKCVPQYAVELLKAIENDDLETFRNRLPVIGDNSTIYDIGRVLLRTNNLRLIYEDIMLRSEGCALGKLFLLFKQYYYYFEFTYFENHRSCDGLVRNIFYTLYQSQFLRNLYGFCITLIEIENLWVDSLILTYLTYGSQMPQSVQEVMFEILHIHPHFDSLKKMFDDCDTENQIETLMNHRGGWLKLEKYDFVLRDREKYYKKRIPPFTCVLYDNDKAQNRKIIDDSYNEFLNSDRFIPLEELHQLQKDVPRLFELENKTNHFNDCVDEGSQVVIEETINEKARRLIGNLLPELYNHLNSGQTPKKLNKFFDTILIDERKPINEQAAQEIIVKKLFHTSSNYEYNGLKVIVFCRIIGYLLSEKVGVLTGEPKPIAEKLQPFLTRTNVQNGEDPNSVENLRSYIEKAKTGETEPPGKSLIDIVLGLKGG